MSQTENRFTKNHSKGTGAILARTDKPLSEHSHLAESPQTLIPHASVGVVSIPSGHLQLPQALGDGYGCQNWAQQREGVKA